MKNQIKNLAQEALERRTAPFASVRVFQVPVEDEPIGGGTTTPEQPTVEPWSSPIDYPGNSDDHRQDIFNRNN